MSIDIKLPPYKIERDEARSAPLLKLLAGKTPQEAIDIVRTKIQAGAISRDEVLEGLVGAVTFLVNHEQDGG